jgi:hypothetical protein
MFFFKKSGTDLALIWHWSGNDFVKAVPKIFFFSIARFINLWAAHKDQLLAHKVHFPTPQILRPQYTSAMVIGLSIGQRECIKRVMLVVLLMEYHNNICEHTYLLRAAVVHPSLSPWRYLYDNGDDTSFLHLTGVSREAFNILRDILFPPEPTDEFSRRPRGCPKILDNTGVW